MPSKKNLWFLLGTAVLMTPAWARAYTMEALSLYDAGRQYAASERWAQAERAYLAAIHADHTLTQAYKALGTAYYMAGDRKKALRSYERYLATHPDDAPTRRFADQLRASPEAADGSALPKAGADAGPQTRIVETDGLVLTGTVEEMRRDEFFRIRTEDGQLYEVPWDEIRTVNGEAFSHEREFWQKGYYLDLLELGGAGLSYPSATLNALNALRAENNPGPGSQVSIGTLGVYWPVGAARKALLGFNIDGYGDSRAGTEFQLNEYIYALSARYYPLGRIGDGPYLMCDAGPAAVELDGEKLAGWGILAGLGYAFHTGETVHPLLDASYSVKTINGSTEYLAPGGYQGWGVDVGLLW